LLAGCAAVVPFDNRASGVSESTPQGMYRYSFHSHPTGTLHGRLAAEPTSAGFRANTRPRALGRLLGGVAGWCVNWWGWGDLPRGVLMRWESAVPSAAEPAQGTLWTPLRTFQTVLGTLTEPVELRAPDSGECEALLRLEPAGSGAPVSTDFTRLTTDIEALLAQHLYDEQALATKGMRKFRGDLRRVTSVARDEVEYWVGFALAARRLPFSHLGLYREAEPALTERLAQLTNREPGRHLALREDNGLLTLRITDFVAEDYEEIDQAFVDIARRTPVALIVDLRGTPGGTYASLRVAAHLIDKPIPAGVLFGRAARARVLAGKLETFPKVTSLSSADELRRLVAERGAIVGWIEPADPRFDGPVAVLIDGQTASAGEPLAAVLQESGRAVLIGEPTAGAMLSTETFELGQGWKLVIPTADYVTAQSVRLEGRGVQPDRRVLSAEAGAAAVNWWQEQQQESRWQKSERR